MTGSPRRGDVVWVALDPSIGSETRKTRPCLVVSNDKGNEVSDTIIVSPITSKVKKVYSFEVAVSVAGKRGKAMMNQCRTVDKSRLGNTICHLDAETMDATNEALRIAFGLS